MNRANVSAFRARQRGEDEGEQQREAQRGEHPQDGAQQVIRQVDRIEGDRQRLADHEGAAHLHRAIGGEHQQHEHQGQENPVPAIGRGIPQAWRRCEQQGHGQVSSRRKLGGSVASKQTEYGPGG